MNTARCLFSRSKRFEQPRKALAPAGGWACPPKSGSLVNLRCLCHKEDELKQLKSELAALDRKIQLELAPPTPEIAEKEKGWTGGQAGCGRCTERATTTHRRCSADSQSGE